MSRFFIRSERPVTRIDPIMQWSHRDHFGMSRREHAFDEYIMLVVGNIAAAFNGDRLVLARAQRVR